MTRVRAIFAAVSFAVLVGSVVALADEVSVDFDSQIDFSRFHTFQFRHTSIDSPRPELDNPLFAKDLQAAMRSMLVRRHVTETPTQPDLFVDVRVSGDELNTVRRHKGRSSSIS